ncbi:MAG: SDR family oxidoreductase [Novosphingobium sp.]|nr:SDR family oxidoreductase [Novosphingobium sp.]
MAEQKPLSGKVALVTGGARGLGRAYALRLANLGADVAIADIKLDGARDYGEELTAPGIVEEIESFGCRAIGIEGDLGSPETVEQAFRSIDAHLGRLDILVTNAGGAIGQAEFGLPSQTPLVDTELLFRANYLSMMLCCQAATKPMRKQGSGIIVNVSSQSAIAPLPSGNLAVYGAMKAAVAQYTRALAAELGPDGIRANCISPGIIMTARVAAQAKARNIGTDQQSAAIPLRRLGNVEDCAGVLEFLVTDQSRYVTGQCISVCGGAVLTAN